MIRTAARAITASAVLTGACGSTPPREEAGAIRVPAVPASFVVERRPWSYQGHDGWQISTPSVELFTTATDRRLLIRLPDFLELAQAHRLNAILPLRAPPEPLETYVLGSRSEWDAMTRRLLGDLARPYLRIERGGYAAQGRGIFYDLGPRDTFVMAAHEGWHQLVQTSFADPLPIWLDEGLACYMEGFRWRLDQPDRPEFLPWSNEERYDQLRQAAARDALLPLSTLVVSRPQDLLDTDRGGGDALNYYAQCWAFVHFLIEDKGGRRLAGLRAMLADAQNGRLLDTVSIRVGEEQARLLRMRRTGGGALAAYFPDESLSDMDAAFRAYVARAVSTGGRDRALRGESPALR
ncbi:MAG: hypothetical protein D6692_06340 [Planctomycetota bacterium]|nr:MAG: hypothetical protein D6692_06340 [Planctomycetota bacterium]